MLPASEQVFYQDPNVLITNIRANIYGRTYPIANISSVRIDRIEPNRSAGWVVTAIGILALVCFGVTLLVEDAISRYAVFPSAAIGPFGLVVSFIFIGVGIYLLVRAAPRYMLKLGTQFMEADALLAADAKYLDNIARAISAALVQRG